MLPYDVGAVAGAGRMPPYDGGAIAGAGATELETCGPSTSYGKISGNRRELAPKPIMDAGTAEGSLT